MPRVKPVVSNLHIFLTEDLHTHMQKELSLKQSQEIIRVDELPSNNYVIKHLNPHHL